MSPFGSSSSRYFFTHSSFFQSLCVLGYCIFPLDLAALVAVFVKMLWIRLPICAATFAWSVWGASAFLCPSCLAPCCRARTAAAHTEGGYRPPLKPAGRCRTASWSVADVLAHIPAAAVNFLGGTRLEQDRAVLAVFPLFMLFFLLAWMTMLS